MENKKKGIIKREKLDNFDQDVIKDTVHGMYKNKEYVSTQITQCD